MHYVGKYWLYRYTTIAELIEALKAEGCLAIDEAGDNFATSYRNTLLKIHISWGSKDAINAVKLYTDSTSMVNLIARAALALTVKPGTQPVFHIQNPAGKFLKIDVQQKPQHVWVEDPKEARTFQNFTLAHHYCHNWLPIKYGYTDLEVVQG